MTNCSKSAERERLLNASAKWFYASNVQKFGQLQGTYPICPFPFRGILTSDDEEAFHTMLAYASDPLPCSILNLTEHETAVANALFRDIQTYQKHKNTADEESVKEELEERICKNEVKFSETLRSELYLYLIKQTRSVPNVDEERRGWILFNRVAHEILVPQEMMELVTEYLCYVATDPDKDMYIRGIAQKIWTTLEPDLSPSEADQERMAKSEQIQRLSVRLADNGSATVYYSKQTPVSEAIEQIAWTLGLNNAHGLKLLARAQKQEIYLERTWLLSRISQEFMRSATDDDQVHLLIEQGANDVNDEDLRDSQRVNLLYCQIRDAYKHNNDPVFDSDAVALLTTQLFVDHGSSVFENEDEIRQHLHDCLRAKDKEKQSLSLWTKEVRRCFGGLRLFSKSDAKADFIRRFVSNPFEGCTIFNARCEQSTGALRGNESVRIGINKNGIHILDARDQRPLDSVLVDEVESFSRDGAHVLLGYKQDGALQKLSIFSETADALYKELTLLKDPGEFKKSFVFDDTTTQSVASGSTSLAPKTPQPSDKHGSWLQSPASTSQQSSRSSNQRLTTDDHASMGDHDTRQSQTHPLNVATVLRSSKMREHRWLSPQSSFASRSNDGISDTSAKKSEEEQPFVSSNDAIPTNVPIGGRYQLEGEVIPGCPALYNAINIRSDYKVMVLFQESDRCRGETEEFYKLFQQRSDVPKLVEVIDRTASHPSCLVFESRRAFLEVLLTLVYDQDHTRIYQVFEQGLQRIQSPDVPGMAAALLGRTCVAPSVVEPIPERNGRSSASEQNQMHPSNTSDTSKQEMHDAMEAGRVTYLIKIERFVDQPEASVAWDARPCRDVPTFRDDVLPREKISRLNIGGQYRLNVFLQHKSRQLGHYSGKISVRIKLPDEQVVELKDQTCLPTSGGIEIMGLMHLDEWKCEKLERKGVVCGKIEDKYVRLRLLLTVDREHKEGKKLTTFYKDVWVVMHAADDKMRIPCLNQNISDVYSNCPQVMKRTVGAGFNTFCSIGPSLF